MGETFGCPETTYVGTAEVRLRIEDPGDASQLGSIRLVSKHLFCGSRFPWRKLRARNWLYNFATAG